MRNIKTVIIFIIIVITILLGCLIYLNKHMKENSENAENTTGDPFEIKINENIEQVTDYSQFYSIENCVNNYYNYLHNENREAVDSILDTNYKKENQITIENNIEKLNAKNEKYFYADKIEKKEVNINTNEYFVHGRIYDVTYHVIEETDYTIVTDETLYSIIPEDKKNNTDTLNINLEKNDNVYNSIIYSSYSNEDVIKKYFEYFKRVSINNPEIAFSLIDENCKSKKFNNSLISFQDYIKQINISECTLQKYKIQQLENSEYNTEYTGVDNNGNYYIFDEKSPNNFVIKLGI